MTKKGPVKRQGLFFALPSGLRQRAADGAERIADFGSEQPHNGDHDNGDECKNDSVLNQALTLLFRCK